LRRPRIAATDILAATAKSAFRERFVAAAAWAKGMTGFMGGGGESVSGFGFQAGDDEELGGEVAVVEEWEQRGIGFRDC
jgi:hypothetical protein